MAHVPVWGGSRWWWNWRVRSSSWWCVVEVVVVVVGGGPDETTMSTELPGLTDVPTEGLEEITSPALLGDGAWLMLPTIEAGLTQRVAGLRCSTDRPGSGTRTLAGPDDTVSVTELPLGTLVPGDGLAASTGPCRLVALHVVDRRGQAGRRQEGLRAVERGLVMPAGTATFSHRAATFRVTVSPFLTSAPAAGSVEITVPGGSLEIWWSP